MYTSIYVYMYMYIVVYIYVYMCTHEHTQRSYVNIPVAAPEQQPRRVLKLLAASSDLMVLLP